MRLWNLAIAGAVALALSVPSAAIAQSEGHESGQSVSDQAAEMAKEAASGVADKAGEAAEVAAARGQEIAEKAADSAEEAIKEGLTASDSVEGSALSATDIIEATVRGSDGGKLATIYDIILSEDGRVSEYILSFGGYFGIGDRLVAVTLDHLTIGTKEDRSLDIRTDLSKQDLENADTFEYGANRSNPPSKTSGAANAG